MSAQLDVSDRLLTREAWQAFAPRLHICDDKSFQNIDVIDTSTEGKVALAEQIKREGYIQAGNIDWGVDLTLMADTVRALSRAKLSTAFAFLYDEFWIPFYKLHPLYTAFLGSYAMLPDFWVWDVDPQKGDAGWKPHRDKGAMALFPDGSPKSLTTWIPLSNATPLNSCMYLVPPMYDPTYGTADDKKFLFELPGIRALPARPGDVLMWNQAVVHWGSRTSPLAQETRVSMAFEFQRTDVQPFNMPLLKPLSVLPFEARLKLIAKQILQYRHMYRVEAHVEQMALQLVG